MHSKQIVGILLKNMPAKAQATRSAKHGWGTRVVTSSVGKQPAVPIAKHGVSHELFEITSDLCRGSWKERQRINLCYKVSEIRPTAPHAEESANGIDRRLLETNHRLVG